MNNYEVEAKLEELERDIETLSRDADLPYSDILNTLKLRLEHVECDCEH